MKKNKKKKGGYSYHYTDKQIREYSKLTPRQKLEWLEAANDLCRKALKGKTKITWEMFRAGKM